MGNEHLKNIYFMVQAGVTESQRAGARRGIEKTLEIACIREQASILDEIWRVPIVKNGVTYRDPLIRLIAEGLVHSTMPGHLNASRILECMQEDTNQYHCMVVTFPLYFVQTYKDGTTKIIEDIGGLAMTGIGCIMTVAGYTHLTKKEQEEHMYFIGAHEFGHVCNLISSGRSVNIEKHKDYGTHCVNICIMRRSTPATHALKMALRLRLFCSQCAAGLKSRFWHKYK